MNYCERCNKNFALNIYDMRIVFFGNDGEGWPNRNFLCSDCADRKKKELEAKGWLVKVCYLMATN